MSRFSLALLICFAALLLAAPAEEPGKKHITLYVQLVEDTPVELSTGAKWMMDKGDCFPVYMFKDQRTHLILNLSSATFMIDAKHVRVMKDSETSAALESYRKTVTAFLESQSDKWRKSAEETSPSKTTNADATAASSETPALAAPFQQRAAHVQLR